jgi:acyl carrier protein
METFIEQLADTLECTEALNADTELNSLDEWDSLGKLSVISMIMDDYKVTIEGDELKSAETVAELYALIVGKQ